MNRPGVSLRFPLLGSIAALVGYGTACLSAGAADPSTSTKDDEPPLRLIVEVDGKKFDATVGKAFECKLGDRKLAMKVTLEPTRLFALGGIEFEYPNHMTFEADHEIEEVDIWTLEGPETMLMLQRYPGQNAALMLGAVVAGTAGEFDKDQVKKPGKIDYRLLGEKRQATRLEITIESSKILQDFVAIQGDGVGYVLMIQDSTDSGGHGKATRDMVELLGSTLKLGEKKPAKKRTKK